MATQKSLLGEVYSDLLSDRNVREEHELNNHKISMISANRLHKTYLFNKIVCLAAAVRATVHGHAIPIKLEGQLCGLAVNCTTLEAPLPKLLGKVIKNFDVVLDI